MSAELVYKAFGAKPQLPEAVFDRSVAGDDQPVAVMARDADPAASPVVEQMDAERLSGMGVLAAQLVSLGHVLPG